MASLDESVIAFAIKTGDIKQLQQAGVTEADFVDEFRSVWRYITRMKREHDAIPNRQMIRQRFPDIKFPSVQESQLSMVLNDLRQRRKYKEFLKSLERVAYFATDAELVDEAIQTLQADLNGLSLGSSNNNLVDLFSPEISKRMQTEIKKRRSGQAAGLPTGLKKFDVMAGGLQKQKMVTIIGRTGIGKCLAASSEVILPDGTLTTIKEFVESAGDSCVALSKDKQVTVNDVTGHAYQGVQTTYRITLNSGRSIEATASHPFLSGDGWKPLEELKVGDAIAQPAQLPSPTNPKNMSPEWVRLLGYLIGDGCIGRGNGGITFCNMDQELHDDVELCTRVIGFASRQQERPTGQQGKAWTQTLLGGDNTNYDGHYFDRGLNELRSTLDDMGLWKTTSHTKFVPKEIFRCNDALVAQFIAALWDTDGSVEKMGLSYSTVSKDLAYQVQHLLLRLGIEMPVRFGYKKFNGVPFPGYGLGTCDTETIKKFHQQIPLRCLRKQARLKDLLTLREGRKSYVSTDRMPLTETIKKEILSNGWAKPSYIDRYKSGTMTRHAWKSIADNHDVAWMKDMLEWDIRWGVITSIEYVGEQDTYDIELADVSNFVANGIVVHNSWLDLLFVASAVMHGAKVVLYPLEMNLTETAMRLYTIFSQKMFGAQKVLKNYDLTMGRVTPAKVARFLAVLEDKFQGQLYVADMANLSDPYTNERIEAEVDIHKPDMFWVDYLTLLKPPPGSGGAADWQAVRALSNGIKNTAMRRNVIGGCSAQVNREALKTKAFLPRLENIAYGDSIGQDSDLVFSINRKKDYLYYSLVKNRGGPEISRTKVRFFVDEGLIEEVEEEEG